MEKKDKTTNGNSSTSSTTQSIPLSPYNDTDYPLRMEKMVVFESKDDPTAASTYENVDFFAAYSISYK